MTTNGSDLTVVAEWPGRVAEIHVAPADVVQADQEVVTIESMKMLTPVPAPAAGTISEVLVALDDFVNEGEPLFRMAAG